MKLPISDLTKILTGSYVSQIAISETSRKRSPHISDHLSLTSRVVAYGKFHCILKCTGKLYREVIMKKVVKYNWASLWVRLIF